jgi:hypothetical protein
MSKDLYANLSRLEAKQLERFKKLIKKKGDLCFQIGKDICISSHRITKNNIWNFHYEGIGANHIAKTHQKISLDHQKSNFAIKRLQEVQTRAGHPNSDQS